MCVHNLSEERKEGIAKKKWKHTQLRFYSGQKRFQFCLKIINEHNYRGFLLKKSLAWSLASVPPFHTLDMEFL